MILVKEKYGRKTDPQLKAVIDEVYKHVQKNIDPLFETSLSVIVSVADSIMHNPKFLEDKIFIKKIQDSLKEVNEINNIVKNKVKDVKNFDLKKLVKYDLKNIALPDKIKFYTGSIYLLKEVSRTRRINKVINSIIVAGKRLIKTYAKFINDRKKLKETLTEGLSDKLAKLAAKLGKMVLIILSPVLKILHGTIKVIWAVIRPFVNLFDRIIHKLGINHLPTILETGATVSLSLGLTFIGVPLIALTQAINATVTGVTMAKQFDAALSMVDVGKEFVGALF